MKKNINRLTIGVLFTLCTLYFSTFAMAQVKDTSKVVAVAQPDVTASKAKLDRFKVYRALISKAKTYNSFVLMHQVDEKYYLEIPDALMGREMLTVNRLGKSAAEYRSPENPFGYSGDLIGENLFHFEKGPGNKLFIKMKSYRERASDTTGNGMKRSLERNNSESLIQAFNIKAINDSSHTTVIELTEYLNQDNLLFGFALPVKTNSGLGTMVNDRSYMESIHAHADNLSMKMVRTYNKPISRGSTIMAPFTFELISSMILLPEHLMNGRTADKRMPYQQAEYIDFDQNPLGVVNLGYIYRWRLEPADQDAYENGKLSKPKIPIKMHLDTQIPKKWLPYIAKGILVWNKAFESAGFKEAIEVVMPEADSTATYLEDAHLSGVIFKPGAGENWGNLIRDPRTGEILQAQLNFYLQDLSKLYNQYLVQAGALDVKAHDPAYKTELIGQLLTTYISQQMANALGLKANASASAQHAIANLRKNDWLNQHAFNGSLTDPGLINYAAQPEDRINPKNLLARLSESDKWTINWGYRILSVPEQETLKKWILERSRTGDQMYSGDAPAIGNKNVADPRNQNADLGNDAVEASRLGIANLKRVRPNILPWATASGQGYAFATDVYKNLITQYSAYLRHAANQIGGLYIDIKTSAQQGNVFRFVPLSTQQRALKFIQQEAFQTPKWLNDPTLYQRTENDFDQVSKVQKELLTDLLDSKTLAKLLTAQNSRAISYNPANFLKDLSDGIFSELIKNQPITLNRRELQKTYVNKLNTLLQTTAKNDSDLPSVLRVHAKTLMKNIKSAGLRYKGIDSDHLTDLFERLYISLNNQAQPERNNTNPFLIIR